ncbi:MAG: trypsin-like peptidase domain-containing protein [Candidatus Sulfotelmatobacter sp.]
MKPLCVRVLLITSFISSVAITTAMPQPAVANPSLAERATAGNPAETRIPDLLRQFDDSLQALVTRVSPAVVQITVTGFGPQDGKSKDGVSLIVRQRAIGSGVILDPDGYIMTNAHVVEGAQQIRVLLPSPVPDSPLDIAPVGKRQTLDAKLVGEDKEIDLALLKVEGHNFPTLPLGTNRSAHPGQLVIAIGSPEGLQNSVTMGVVSSVWRQADPELPMVYLQTDAPINRGSSGGPLVDLDGYVVGLNTFILSESGGSEGLGFAIPAAAVKFVYQELRKYGHVHRTEIRAAVQEITPTLATGLGLAQNWGVVISDVEPGGPAEEAGLEVQDVVLTVDTHPIMGLPGLTAALYLHPPDEELTVVVLRGSRTISLSVPALEHRDEMDQLANLVDPRNRIGGLGIFAVDFKPQLPSVADIRFHSGVVVVALTPGPDTQSRSFQAGDVIHSLNNTPVKSVEQLRAALHQLKAGDPVVLQVERQRKLHYVAFDME